MTYFCAVMGLVVIAAVALYVRSNSAYYARIFSEAHYREIVEWLRSTVRLSLARDETNPEAMVHQTAAGCALVYTRRIAERDVIHLSISQVGRPTTHSVGEHLGGLVMQVFKQNHAEANLIFTESTVHHVVLSREVDGEWLVNEADEAIEGMKAYQRMPFRFQPTE